MRLVLDTNVLVAGLRSDRGASRKLLLGALDRKIEVIASVPLFLEYESVLTRPQHLTATGLSIDEMNAVLDALAAVVERVQLRFLWRARLKDPADEMVLETAANGRADRLVTFNVRHFLLAAKTFGIVVRTPPEVWKEVQLRNEKK
ncbi:MAG: putative toxin-antitoxin system toxin component, PIN family [Bryobacteraceae bacterium]